MFLWTAFILGLVGSLHCAGMCGPLAMAVPVVGRGTAAIAVSRVTYNLGRLLTYAIIGGVFGLAGEALALAGIQRWVSIVAGVLILLGLVVYLNSKTSVVTLWIARLKNWFGPLLRKRSHSSLLALGMVNGLLPCGLVYVAAAAGMTTESWVHSAAYLFVFGLGTLPMMFGIGLLIGGLTQRWRMRLQKLVPISLAVVGGLLVLRGSGLGIPFLSPAFTTAEAACELCGALPRQ